MPEEVDDATKRRSDRREHPTRLAGYGDDAGGSSFSLIRDITRSDPDLVKEVVAEQQLDILQIRGLADVERRLSEHYREQRRQDAEELKMALNGLLAIQKEVVSLKDFFIGSIQYLQLIAATLNDHLIVSSQSEDGVQEVEVHQNHSLKTQE